MRSQTEWPKAFSESEAVMREFILNMRREQLEILARQMVESKKWAKEREERRQTGEESAKLDAVEARLQQTHYEALGVAPTANATQIRTAYRKLAIECHPDKFPKHAERATELFQKLQKIQEIVENPKQREEYDRWLRGKVAAGRANPSRPPNSTPQAQERGSFEGWTTITI